VAEHNDISFRDRASTKQCPPVHPKGLKGEEKGEKGEPALPPSSGHGLTADDVIAEAMGVNPRASFSAKAKLGIVAFLSKTDAGREVILMSVRERIGRMDDFELKNAGNTLATELPGLIATSHKALELERQRGLQALAELISQRDRAKYDVEQKKRDEEDAYAAAHAHEI
jgi:hypothetical protein